MGALAAWIAGRGSKSQKTVKGKTEKRTQKGAFEETSRVPPGDSQGPKSASVQSIVLCLRALGLVH